jgi:hypothetical protein
MDKIVLEPFWTEFTTARDLLGSGAQEYCWVHPPRFLLLRLPGNAISHQAGGARHRRPGNYGQLHDRNPAGLPLDTGLWRHRSHYEHSRYLDCRNVISAIDDCAGSIPCVVALTHRAQVKPLFSSKRPCRVLLANVRTAAAIRTRTQFTCISPQTRSTGPQGDTQTPPPHPTFSPWRRPHRSISPLLPACDTPSRRAINSTSTSNPKRSTRCRPKICRTSAPSNSLKPHCAPWNGRPVMSRNHQIKTAPEFAECWAVWPHHPDQIEPPLQLLSLA